MIRALGFLAFLVLQGVNAQLYCVPEPVQNVSLSLNYVLSWAQSSNCEDTQYLIYIHLDEENLQYIFTSNENRLDVSFLPACERFSFQINAMADNELSEPARIVSYIPAPSGTDLTITSFTASVQDGATFLNWHVTEKFAHCARGFRLVIRDAFNRVPRDVYTDRNNIFLNNLIPCAQYEFGIMAIYNIQAEGPINLIDYHAPQENVSLPLLENVNVGETYVNLTWGLPPYSINRCPISAVEVEGLPFLHEIFPVEDSPERPPFTTSLTSLRPDNMYILRVSIVNSAGSSAPLPIGVQTLPAGSG